MSNENSPVSGKRLLIHSTFLFLLPLIVAAWGISLPAAMALVLLALLWRWMISLSSIMAPAKTPEMELETISASHFVEKVRWCLDRLEIDYVEKPKGGTLGAFFLGRTVPVLKFRTGVVRSHIGNSPEILRYLWGRYSLETDGRADFLEPLPERIELEKKIDRCGADLQVWIYYHILDDKDLTLHAWGFHNPAVAAWQRHTLFLIYPVLRTLIRKAFRISDGHHAKSVKHIDTLLGEVEVMLKDGRSSLLGGATPNYSDFAFAAIMGLWLLPPEYGGGKAQTSRFERDEMPPNMREEVEGWENRFPAATKFIHDMYQNHRFPPTDEAKQE